MYKEQWDKFVSIVRQISDNNMVDGAEVWLMLQDQSDTVHIDGPPKDMDGSEPVDESGATGLCK